MSRAFREIGLYEAARGNLDVGEQMLSRAVEYAPDALSKAEAQVAHGSLLASIGETRRALDLLQQGIAELPDDHRDLAYAKEQLRGLR